MRKRFVMIWFRYLLTDWASLRNPALQKKPFVLSVQDHGRMIVSAINKFAEAQSIDIGMTIADARAIYPSLEVLNDKPGLADKLLGSLAEWFIRYSPIVSIHQPDGLIIDATGCTHLWNGEENYLNDIVKRLNGYGYQVRAAMADTIGAAWAIAHFSNNPIAPPQQQINALLKLPPAALRIDSESCVRLHKLGLKQIQDFINIPRPVLLRRFGSQFLEKFDQAVGIADEYIESIHPKEPYQERLNSLEPIQTLAGIEHALHELLDKLNARLCKEQKGLRKAIFKTFRVDGKNQVLEIGTNHASNNTTHIFKLFEEKLSSIEPGPGIELFILEAHHVEDAFAMQEKLWDTGAGFHNVALAELLDRIAGKVGLAAIQRYLPDQHHWPERSIKPAQSLREKATICWDTSKPRPVRILPNPELIVVSAPIPDYPPMNFRYKGILHKIIKADGPERIEQEWWIQQGQHRDYYYVEDEEGRRYWLFRSGHYDDKDFKWYIHGFFA